MNFIMDFNSMDEDESTFPSLPTEISEDYMETCDDEVNDIVPRFQLMNINDEPIELRSEIINEPTETFPCLSNYNFEGTEGTSTAASSVKVSPTFISDKSGNIWMNEVTKATIDKEKSLSTTNETTQAIPANIPVDSQSQDVVQRTSTDMHPINQKDGQKLEESEEMKETGAENVLDESPLNLCLMQKLDHNYAAEPSSTVSENEIELLPIMTAPKKTKQLDPEISEISDIASNILPESQGSKNNALGLYDTIVDRHSPKLSYSADVSSDDQSHMNSGVMNDSSPDTYDSGAVNTTLVEAKRHRKFAVLGSPTSQMNQIRQRRFSIFQPPSSNNAEIEISKGNSTSDEDSKKSSTMGKDSPVNSKRRYRKTKSSSRQRIPIPPDAKNDEEKRPSPYKRKISIENLVGTTGKFRKRSISERNSETGKKTHLVIRSRSLSPGLKVTNPSVETSPIQTSRKRTSSDFQNIRRIKSRKSSSSCDDAENK